MKKILNSKMFLLFGMFISGFIVCISSCKNDDTTLPYVDLRYNPEDTYTVTASSPQTIEFEVSSTFPWEILSKGDWHTITPANGDADSIYKVKITCQENTVLDDRIDTLIIKSDHWIGKKVILTQKGTAWLTPSYDTLTVESTAGQSMFSITSNQDWSCEVTQGNDWLSIIDGDKGSINGDVSILLKENQGELRYGIITLFDRHHQKVDQVVVAQNGVLLIPSVDEIRSLYFEGDFTFNVASNSKWKISKSEYDIWFTIEGEEIREGSGIVTLHLKENSGVSLRKSEITLMSVSDDESVAPVVKTIILKQACKPAPTIHEFTGLFPGGSVNSGSLDFIDGDMIVPAGGGRELFTANNFGSNICAHYFRIKEMGAGSYPTIFFVLNWNTELRFHISTSTGKTDASYTHYSSVPLIAQSGDNIAIDVTKPHILGIAISDAGGLYAGKTKVELSIDYDKTFMTYIMDVPPTSNLSVYLGGQPGPCVWDWYGRDSLIDWDN